jgi:hypothetical protein
MLPALGLKSSEYRVACSVLVVLAHETAQYRNMNGMTEVTSRKVNST